MIDLHTHTTASDGDASPAKLIALCQSLDITVVAITDHDCVDGILEAKKMGLECNVTVVSGIEMSTDFSGTETHLLGLFVDETNGELCDYCTKAQLIRNKRGAKIIQKLRSGHIEISKQEEASCLYSRAKIGKLLVEKGMVATVREAFLEYLGKDGVAYVDKERIPIGEAIKLIHRTGGIAVLAHLSTLSHNAVVIEKIVEELQQMGLDGIECYYSEYSKAFTQRCVQLAQKKGLLQSGGSDYHGEGKKGLFLGRGYGNLNIPITVYEKLLAYQKM